MRRNPGTKTADIRGSWSRNLHLDMLVALGITLLSVEISAADTQRKCRAPRKSHGFFWHVTTHTCSWWDNFLLAITTR